MLKKIFILLIIICYTAIINAQTIDDSDSLKWQMPYTLKITDNQTYKYLYFEGANLHLDNGILMPSYTKQIPIANGNVNTKIIIKNIVFQPLEQKEIGFINQDVVKENVEIQTTIVYTKKQAYLQIEFSPFRKINNTYEKVIYYDIAIEIEAAKTVKEQKAKTYATQSILASGNFYKIAIEKTGVHKITYADLESMGVNMSGLKTNNLSLFGNGGNLLPENTSAFTYDDLNEVPIQVIDINGNGIFESNDYILFYGIGIIGWQSGHPFNNHTINIYSNYAYYFINVDPNIGSKKRVASLSETSLPKTHDVNSFYFYNVIEKEAVNPNEVSRVWFSDVFDAILKRSYSFSVPELASNEKFTLRFSLAAKSPSINSSFTATINNNHTYSLLIPSTSISDNGKMQTGNYSFAMSGNTINIDLTYSKPTNNAVGYLDYIEVHGKCKLQATNNQILFRNNEVVGSGNVAEYHFDTKGGKITIWEVSNPHNITKIIGREANNTIEFKLTADSLREFIAFTSSNYYTVTPIGKISNQNLHGYTTADFIIVTHPDFLEYANQLAAFRKKNDNMSCITVTTQQIYNEFSSGAQDISAIRNFLKMLYDRNPTNYPKNVLLFGKTSYDFRNILGSNSNFIPNYQGSCPFAPNDCLSTDDFFVKLDDGEGNNNNGSMDMGIGRFSVSTKSQAQIVVQKSINYGSKELMTANNIANFSNWRNYVTFSADDDADQGHLGNADAIAGVIFNNFPTINIDKIYLDAYKKIFTSQGQRYPSATDAMNQRINKGTLMFTYMGHGGDNGWAHERYLTRTDIHSWKNKYNLPLFYAGSCSFGMYDKTNSQSPSEDILLKSDGGGIGVISATRNSFGGSNEFFGKMLHQYAFEKINGRYRTMGEFLAAAKNVSGSIEMYVLFGDPSLTLAHPKENIVTDSINGISLSSINDTIQALEFITIKGRVTDNNNQTLQNFNGYVYPTIYDKPSLIKTLLNNPNSVEKTFILQKNVLFKGKASVKNGHFEFSFLVPKDINYEYGYGKISYYATNNHTDANGFDSIFIGGIKDTIIADNKGPEIEIYLNNRNFVNGGISNPHPTLIAYLKDDNGINTVGTGIGHDIIAFLDNKIENSILLNDFFEYDENSSSSGKVSYLLSNLEPGPHTLTVRAWDVLNNMNENTINFTVIKDEKLELSHVLNYPNPFTTHTDFYFEHNQPNTTIKVSIQIFTVSGKLVKTIEHTSNNNSFRCGPIPWNGLDDFGDKLAKGVYIYKVRVKTAENKTIEKFEKLVIL